MAPLVLRDAVTGTNYGPVLSVITWILMVTMVLSVSAKVALKFLTLHSLGLDDSVLLLAMVTIQRAYD